ncbi:MAG: hypothetical protein Q8P34_15850 [Bacteroidota bacterium]|nr:hypothetical protein [Bacteroidota bacterium]
MAPFHHSKLLPKIILLLIPILVLQFSAVGQVKYPYLKAELKTNLSKITCLDNFDLEAKQINWELQNPNERKLLFQNLNFFSPEIGLALALVPGAGEYKFFFKTSDSGREWAYDKIIKM